MGVTEKNQLMPNWASHVAEVKFVFGNEGPFGDYNTPVGPLRGNFKCKFDESEKALSENMM